MHTRPFVTSILRGRYDVARTLPPRLTPDYYREILRSIELEFGPTPWRADPLDLLARERFTVLITPDAPPHGLETSRRILLRPELDPVKHGLIAHHARAHAWLNRRGELEATEADAWFLTAEIAWPRSERRGPCYHPYLPRWFLDAAKCAEGLNESLW